jgi:hypothetical protein
MSSRYYHQSRADAAADDGCGTFDIICPECYSNVDIGCTGPDFDFDSEMRSERLDKLVADIRAVVESVGESDPSAAIIRIKALLR